MNRKDAEREMEGILKVVIGRLRSGKVAGGENK